MGGVSTKSNRNWIKKENDIKNAKNLFKIILHPGGKPKFENIEKKIYDFVCFNKALGNLVTTWSNNNINEIENDNIKKLQNRIIGFIKDMDLH